MAQVASGDPSLSLACSLERNVAYARYLALPEFSRDVKTLQNS
jgi:hypothetical protein